MPRRLHPIPLIALAALGLSLACTPDPATCYDAGDEKACNALCDTGEPTHRLACSEIRARNLVACADGQGDCKSACADWKNAEDDKERAALYVTKLGAKAAALKDKCK